MIKVGSSMLSVKLLQQDQATPTTEAVSHPSVIAKGDEGGEAANKPELKPGSSSHCFDSTHRLTGESLPLFPPKFIVVSPKQHHSDVHDHHGFDPTPDQEEPKQEDACTEQIDLNAIDRASTEDSQSKTSDYDDSSLNVKSYDCTVTATRERKLLLSRHSHRDLCPRYAMKRVKASITDPDELQSAMMDLACEGKFLQHISHSNIVRLRAVIGTPGTPSYGLIMDRLGQTLDQRIVDWKARTKEYRGRKFLFGIGSKRHQSEQLVTERLLVAYDIARAMSHLHRKRILYRDCKDTNCGFTVSGVVNIFDFGIAKELKERDLREYPDGYEATGMTGSRRYMAPEVLCCKYYGFRADVYSFGVLFWQIMALKTPFDKYDANEHFARAALKRERPKKLGDQLSGQVATIMEQAWATDPLKRPSMKDVCRLINTAIAFRADKTYPFTYRSNFLMNRSLCSWHNGPE
jgi:Protein kinase domain